MILIINANGFRLCNDGYWRNFAMFGNVKGCVKQYRYKGHALRRAKHLGGIVVQVPQGMEVDASGVVIETIPVGADKVRYQHHKLSSFPVH
ncbi:MAG: hypothetical protein M0R80_23555 [Proteobacteria bacterium]|nr:hypothetical protein [Pseudomonadota bacterium]